MQRRTEAFSFIRAQQAAELRDLVRKYYILLMMYDTNASTGKYIMSKYEKGVLPPDINIDLIRKSLADQECVVCKNHINETARKHLQDLLDKYEVSTNVSHRLVEIKNDVLRAIEDAKNYRSAKDALFEKIRKTEEDIETLTAQNEELYKKIIACSSAEDIGGGGGSRTRVPTRSNEDFYMLISSLLFFVLCRSR